MQAARGAPLTESPTSAGGHRRRRALALFAAVALTAYVVDVVTKVAAVARIEPGGDVPVVGELLRLTLVRNPGAAFSTGTQATVALSIFALVAALVVLLLARRVRDRLWAVGLGLLLGGVLGNLTDRLLREPGPLRGHVIDFLRLPNWPVFNVADMCINAAAVVILVQAFRGVRLDGRRDRAASDATADGEPGQGAADGDRP